MKISKWSASFALRRSTARFAASTVTIFVMNSIRRESTASLRYVKIGHGIRDHDHRDKRGETKDPHDG